MRVVLLAGVLLLLAGCGAGGDSSQGASDCGSAIRAAGTVYQEAGFVEGPAQSWGQADSASCDDTGQDPQGAYFPDDPRQVDVWSFEGQDTDVVLGVLESDDTFRVFVADGADVAEVMRNLKQSQKTSQ